MSIHLSARALVSDSLPRVTVVALITIAIALTGCGGTSQQSASAAPTASPTMSPEPTATAAPEYQATYQLAVGDCFDPVADMDDQILLAGLMRDCDEPHLMQVFGHGTISDPIGAPYPQGDEVDQQTASICEPAFKEFVGVPYEDSRLSATYYSPSEDSWQFGDRAVMCVIEASEASPLTRSVEGLNR
jgi:hypothetical protein